MLQVSDSKTAYIQLKKLMRSDVEEVWILALSSEKRILKVGCLFKGTVDSCLVHPRDIFKFAVINNATSFILAHNHPQASTSPSLNDLKLTLRILQAAAIMGISFTDHLILNHRGYFSFRDQKLMNQDVLLSRARSRST